MSKSLFERVLECEHVLTRARCGEVGSLGLSLGRPCRGAWAGLSHGKGFNQVCAEVRFALLGDFQPPWVFSIFFLIQACCVLKKDSETHMSD